MYAVNQGCMTELEYCCHFVRRHIFFRCRARMAAIHTASHVDHGKRVAWFSMHACGSLPIVMMLHLVALQAVGATLFSSETSVC